MPLIDCEQALQPLQPDQPCGPALQYDKEFIALELATQGKPEQQYGDTIIPAEEPDWRETKRLALGLAGRTMDLRVACNLARAAAHIDGAVEFCNCLALIRGYLDRYWDSVHPQLDPEDDNDPTERVNVLSSLADKATTVASVLAAPIVEAPRLGRFSLRDVKIARGEIPAPADEQPPDSTSIDAAFLNCDLASLQHTADALARGYADAMALEAAVTDRVGAAQAVSLEQLTDVLRAMRDLLNHHIQARQGEGDDEASGEDSGDGQADLTEADAQPAARPSGAAGEIRTRDDVIRALDRICAYYERYEPSSPLPLLLKRAQRLVTKRFIEILQDLTPDAVGQARIISGQESDDDN